MLSGVQQLLRGPWRLSFADALAYPDQTGWLELGTRTELHSLTREPRFRDKTGTLRYEADFEFAGGSNERVTLDLGRAYETVEVFVNGSSAGVCLCPPYRVDITRFLRTGQDSLVIEVTNTLGNENKEFMSQYTPIEPFGLIGPVKLMIEKE